MVSNDIIIYNMVMEIGEETKHCNSGNANRIGKAQ